MSDLVSSGINFGFNTLSNEVSFDQQWRLQKDQQKYNTLMYNLNNQYNSAAQQMARFRSAGLNSNLIYGQMQNGLAAPTSGQGSAPTPVRMDPFDTLALEQQKANLDKTKAEEENIKKNTEKTASDIAVNDATIVRFGVQNGLDEKQVEFLGESINKFKVECDKMRSEIGVLNKQVEVLEQQRKLTKYQAQNEMIRSWYENEKVQAEIENIKSSTGLNDFQVRRGATLLFAELANFKAVTRKLLSDANTNVVLRQLYNREAELYGVQKSNAEKEGQRLDNEITQWNKTYGNMLGGHDPNDAGGLTGTYVRLGIAFQPFMNLIGTIVGSTIVGSGMKGAAMKGAAKINSAGKFERAVDYISNGNDYGWMSSY